ncbi:MAG: trypsin-like serine protease [Myxococcales bacterium]|nr:trypsin-like serine protease [Myxococcales bacterium]
MHYRIGALALLVAGCDPALCLDPDDVAAGLGSASAPIVGGTVDTTSRSTVALLLSHDDGSRALCSGSVIATHGSRAYVLTAAHCVQGSVDNVYEAVDWRDCEAGGDAAKCLASYQVVSWQAHPGYDSETLDNDVAMVIVEGAQASTAVTPALADDSSVVAGQSMELSGYGRTYAGPQDPAQPFNTVRHKVAVPLDAKTAKWLRFDASTGETACFGDSGGPAFAHVDGKLVVAGVASNADAECAVVANYARVALVYESFIAPLIDADGPDDPPPEGGSGGGSTSSTGGAAPVDPGPAGGAGGATDGGSAGEPSDPGGDGQDPDGADSNSDSDEICIPLSLECAATRGPARSTLAFVIAALALGLLGRRSRRLSRS